MDKELAQKCSEELETLLKKYKVGLRIEHIVKLMPKEELPIKKNKK